ncbi:MAG: hypothetical protein JXQ84_09325 [Rhodospirillaceae bacterium]|nr:hypothetical protein [Rhodospirillaceae bacterium]
MIGKLLIYAPWAVLVVAFLFLKVMVPRLFPSSRRGLIFLGGLWILMVQGDSLLLGPLAPLEWGDGEMMFYGYFPYLANTHDGLFLHDVIGGVDRYALGRIGGGLVSARVFLSGVMPMWLLLVLMRLFVSSTALYSIFLFSRRRLDCPPVAAFALGALFSAGFDVNTSMTFLYGLSIAALPLLLYFLFSLDREPRRWLIYTAVCLVYVMFADPFFWLAGLWAVALCMLLWHKPNSWVGFFVGLIALSLLWLANYSEAIWAVLQMTPYSSRPPDFLRSSLVDRFGFFARWMLFPQLLYNAGGLAYSVPIVFALWVGYSRRAKTVLLAAVSALVVGFASPVLISVPWADLGLNFLQSYRWYLEYAAFPLSMLAAAAAAAALQKIKTTATSMPSVTTLASACLAVGIAMLFVLKSNIILHMATRGNLTMMQDIPNLKNHTWYPEDNSRVVGIPTTYMPNLSPSYGLPAYDGSATFIPKSTFVFWRDLVLRQSHGLSFSDPGFPLNPHYLECCEPYPIEQDAALDMLRVLNVGYILSYRALASDRLHQVSGPVVQRGRMRLRDVIRRPAQDIFVYAIPDPLPRVYGVRQVVVIDDEQPREDLLHAIAQHAPQRDAVFLKSDSRGIGDGEQISPLAIEEYRIIKDGYDITLTAKAPGLIIVNVPYFPWWAAESEAGAQLSIRPVNIGQIAIAVPAHTRQIYLRYKRITLFPFLHSL